MMEHFIASYGGRLLIAVLGVGAALAASIAALRFFRGDTSARLTRGRSGKRVRLRVVETAAIDARRRLVLIRRDDVEHLIMIGGSADIVIETGISGGVETKVPENPAPPAG